MNRSGRNARSEKTSSEVPFTNAESGSIMEDQKLMFLSPLCFFFFAFCFDFLASCRILSSFFYHRVYSLILAPCVWTKSPPGSWDWLKRLKQNVNIYKASFTVEFPEFFCVWLSWFVSRKSDWTRNEEIQKKTQLLGNKSFGCSSEILSMQMTLHWQHEIYGPINLDCVQLNWLKYSPEPLQSWEWVTEGSRRFRWIFIIS